MAEKIRQRYKYSKKYLQLINKDNQHIFFAASGNIFHIIPFY